MAAVTADFTDASCCRADSHIERQGETKTSLRLLCSGYGRPPFPTASAFGGFNSHMPAHSEQHAIIDMA